MTEPTQPSVPESSPAVETKPMTSGNTPVTVETAPVADEDPPAERVDTLVNVPAAASADSPKSSKAEPASEIPATKVEPMTRESALDSKEPEKKPAEPMPSDIWGVLYAILSTPWGRRIALVIVGIVLLFTGYVSGRWGRSDLEGKVSDLKAQIVGYKKDLKNRDVEIATLTRQRDELELKLRDSEEKREFYRQRDKIRKYLADSRKAWEARNVKEALEALHKANIHFQSETRAAKGVSNYLYRTITRRITQALTAMETDCADTKPAQMSAFEPAPVPAVSCLDRVNTLLQQVLDALPPARED